MDSVLTEVISLINGGWHSKKQASSETQNYWGVKEELSVAPGFLYRGTRLVPPSNLRLKLVNLICPI